MLLFDGSFGTYYREKTQSNRLPEGANISDPALVYKIHREYIEAGAQAITTNTFAANSSSFSSKSEIEEILKEGLNIADKASKGQVEIYSSIGYINSQGNLFSTKEEEYLYITETLIGLGSKNFIFESFPNYQEIEESLKLIKEGKIYLSFSVNQEGYSHDGFYFIDLIKEASKLFNLEGIGLNCTLGPLHMLKLLEEFKEKENKLFSSLNISAMPNSGYPSRVNGIHHYEENASYFAKTMVKIRNLGVNTLGACCGSQPIHIRKMVEALQEKRDQKIHLVKTIEKEEVKEGGTIRSPLIDKLENGEKIIAVELDPPFNSDTSFLIESAKVLKKEGANLITIADSPLARIRACSFMVGASIKRQADIDVVPHLTCRDKNNIGIAATLLGGKAEGIDNVLCITGDPPALGTKGVFSYNSFKLIEYINRMNKKQFFLSPYAIGGAINTSARNFDQELERARKKQEGGAKFFLSQPLYTEENISNLIKAKEDLNGAYILGGILPLASYKNALFLNNEVPGINIPNNIISSLEGKSLEEANDISVSFSIDIINKIYNKVDGLYLMLPLKRLDLITNILKRIEGRIK